MTDDNGLYYMRARYYSPELMRFISADPLTQSIAEDPYQNVYAYANGNPISYIDPFGTSATLGHTALDAAGFIPGAGIKIASKADDVIDAAKVAEKAADAVTATRMTAKQATSAAKELGFEKTNYFSHGQPVFKKVIHILLQILMNIVEVFGKPQVQLMT